jgi:hypothetical protein
MQVRGEKEVVKKLIGKPQGGDKIGRSAHTENGFEMDLRKIHSRVRRHKVMSLGDAHQKAGFVRNTAVRIPSPLIKAVYKVLS